MKLYKKIIRELFRDKITKKFINSAQYWEDRYYYGGNSGSGSYYKNAVEKADYLNAKIDQFDIDTMVDIGCGDGNNLKLFKTQNYYGFDVSKTIISQNKREFKNDQSKQFSIIDKNFEGNLSNIRSQKNIKKIICVSFDVIGHLVEDNIYANHLRSFDLVNPDYLIISNFDVDLEYNLSTPHIKARNYSKDLLNMGWKLVDVHPKNNNLKLFQKK
tara:strand:- start:575 stop:1219 length:645 start_codon:yes stop_codon:yes gene_type:complete